MSMQKPRLGVQDDLSGSLAATQAVVRDAVQALADDGPAAFFRKMWLGIGDGWTNQRTWLKRKGLIEFQKDDVHRPVITPEGRAWLEGGGPDGMLDEIAGRRTEQHAGPSAHDDSSHRSIGPRARLRAGA